MRNWYLLEIEFYDLFLLLKSTAELVGILNAMKARAYSDARQNIYRNMLYLYTVAYRKY